VQRAYTLLLESEDDMELCGMSKSAEDAMYSLQEKTCDLVVVDVSLPGMDGIELTRHLLERKPSLLVLVTSMADEAAYGARARGAGAQAYMCKLAEKETLVDAIRKVLHADLV
jgi:DNA-binding NarL/FixJ family response regulator